MDILKSLEKDLGWTFDSVIDYDSNISNKNPSAGSNCIKLATKSNHPKTFWLMFITLITIDVLNVV